MSLPDLDDLIAEVDRTCPTANPTGGGDQPDWIELLKAAAGLAGKLEALGDDLVEEYVEHCRLHRCSWAGIGEALGVARQAGPQRLQSPPQEDSPPEVSWGVRARSAGMG